MPNWTDNHITFTGNKKDIKAIRKRLGEEFDFNSLIPMPESLDLESGSKTQSAIIAYIAEENGGIENLESNEDAMRFLRANTFLGFNKDIFLGQLVKTLVGAFRDLPPETFAPIIKKTLEILGPEIEKKENESFLVSRIRELKVTLPIMEEEEKEKLLELGHTYVDNIRKYGAPTWYEWRCNNWGTKWTAKSVAILKETDDTLVYAFDTAWAPPVPIYELLEEEILKKYPSVSFELWYRNEDDWQHEYGLKFTPDPWEYDEEYDGEEV